MTQPTETRVMLLEQALREICELLYINGGDQIKDSLRNVQKALYVAENALDDELPR